MSTNSNYSHNQIPILDDFIDDDDSYSYCTGNDTTVLLNNDKTCCCCCTDIYCDVWWFYHDTFDIKKNNILLHSAPNNPHKIICCNLCSWLCEITYKCYGMKSYYECCCCTCISVYKPVMIS